MGTGKVRNCAAHPAWCDFISQCLRVRYSPRNMQAFALNLAPKPALQPALHFDNVSKRYGPGPLILDRVSFAVEPGAFFGLAGINGAGKTSLIKCLLDLADFSSGNISIFGAPSRDFASRRRLSFLPERFMPPHYLTGRDFLRMMAALQRHAHDEATARAMCEKLDLPLDALTLPVRAFSKGMTQKLGLAATFLAQADLLVLDEPMSGLDPKARALVKDQLLSLRSAGRTLFFTSHQLADVEELCDRVAILHQGQVAFGGTPQELLGSTGAPNLERAFLRVIDADASLTA